MDPFVLCAVIDDLFLPARSVFISGGFAEFAQQSAAEIGKSTGMRNVQHEPGLLTIAVARAIDRLGERATCRGALTPTSRHAARLRDFPTLGLQSNVLGHQRKPSGVGNRQSGGPASHGRNAARATGQWPDPIGGGGFHSQECCLPGFQLRAQSHTDRQIGLVGSHAIDAMTGSTANR